MKKGNKVENDDSEVQWVDDHINDERDFIYLTSNRKGKIEEKLSDRNYLHGCHVHYSLQSQLSTDVTYKSSGPQQTFNGIRLDTCANRRSVMAIGQYHAYYTTFGLSNFMCPIRGKEVRGIGGTSKAIGEANISIRFREIGIMIDVDLLNLPGTIPSLLSMKDITDNNLYLFIQERYISWNGRTEKLQLVNNLLIYNWHPNEHPYILYTITKLMRIHATFGHP